MSTIFNQLLDIQFDCNYEYISQRYEQIDYQNSILTFNKSKVSLRELQYYLKKGEPGAFRTFNTVMVPAHVMMYVCRVYRDCYLIRENKLPKTKLQFSSTFITSINKIMRLGKNIKLQIENQTHPVDVFLFYFFRFCSYLIDNNLVTNTVDVLKFRIPIDEKCDQLLIQYKKDICPYDSIYYFSLNPLETPVEPPPPKNKEKTEDENKKERKIWESRLKIQLTIQLTNIFGNNKIFLTQFIQLSPLHKILVDTKCVN